MCVENVRVGEEQAVGNCKCPSLPFVGGSKSLFLLDVEQMVRRYLGSLGLRLLVLLVLVLSRDSERREGREGGGGC